MPFLEAEVPITHVAFESLPILWVQAPGPSLDDLIRQTRFLASREAISGKSFPVDLVA